MKRILFLVTILLPVASFAQSYTTNGVVYATSSSTANSSTAASTSPGQLLIGTGGAPTWASSLPFGLMVNMNTSGPAPGLQGMGGVISLALTGPDATGNRVFMDTFNGTSVFGFRRAQGTNASPQAVGANEALGTIAWSGYNGSSYTVAPSAQFNAASNGGWSTTDTNSLLRFSTTATGSTTITEQMRLWGSGGLSLGNSIITIDPGASNLLVAGRVGIGTTDQTYPLSVNGTIEAKEVLVQSGWSDYVLAPAYHLEPLKDVAASIRREGHLPGVPSAVEVAEHGAKLGEIQTILLAKIEELTLHAIEQERRLDEQARRIDDLAEMNEELGQRR